MPGHAVDEPHTPDSTSRSPILSVLYTRRDGGGTWPALVDAWPLFGLVIRTERLELRLPTRPSWSNARSSPSRASTTRTSCPSALPGRTSLVRSSSATSCSTTGALAPTGHRTIGRSILASGSTESSSGRRACARRSSRSFDRSGRDRGWGGVPGQKIGLEMRSAVCPSHSTIWARSGRRARRSWTTRHRSGSRARWATPTTATLDGPAGVARQEQRFLMTREMWHSRERPPISVRASTLAATCSASDATACRALASSPCSSCRRVTPLVATFVRPLHLTTLSGSGWPTHRAGDLGRSDVASVDQTASAIGRRCRPVDASHAAGHLAVAGPYACSCVVLEGAVRPGRSDDAPHPSAMACCDATRTIAIAC